MTEKTKSTIRKCIFVILAALLILFSLLPTGLKGHAPGLAVIAGAVSSLTFGNPFPKLTGKLVSPLLGSAIVGMGFGMNLFAILKAGVNGISYTFIGISAGIGLGLLIGKRLGVARNTMYLVSIGTSICGGSAIAAAAPVLKAKAHEVAVASATVFILNAIALLIFPFIGHALGMGQIQFGYWAALGIHDTSSVVGATLEYGSVALDTGTTIKLARALWIVPVTLLLSWFVADHAPDAKRKLKLRVPWFIPGFIGAAVVVTFLPVAAPAGTVLKSCSQYLMVLTLFLIGSNLSSSKLREIGFRPIMLGIILWIILAAAWGMIINCGLIAVR